MKISDFKIATRIYLGFGTVIAILALLVTVAYTNFVNLVRANDLNVHTHQVMAELDAVLAALLNIETGQRGYALTGADSSLEPYNIGKAGSSTHLDKAIALTADNAQQQDRLRRLASEQQRWLETAIDPVIDLRRSVVNGAETMDSVVAAVQAGKGKQGMDTMRALIEEMLKEEETLLEQRSEEAVAMQEVKGATLIGGGIAAALLGAFLAIWLQRNITRPLAAALHVAGRVARGDLTGEIQVRSKDEAGQLMQALKDMNLALVRIVSEVRAGTETIVTASTQITSGNLDLSSRTEQQASSLEETASSMEELTGTVKQNAEHARQAASVAAITSEVAAKGGTVVSQVVETMGSINQSSRRIVDIIGVIDGIAFQTNILALNAAVEAARAGEQGRGFAVVASEVRNLAQRSAAAAKEIKLLIDDSVEKVETGSRLVDEAGNTMSEIVNSVRRVTEIISEIADASAEQRAGIEQVNQAIGQMDQVTQQNAALVEEAAAAAESLQDQADSLSRIVSVFRIDGGTGMQTSPVPESAALPPYRHTASRPMLADVILADVKAPSVPVDRNFRVVTGSGEQWEEF